MSTHVWSSSDLQQPHHSLIFVIEDVVVKHPLSRKSVEPHHKPRLLEARHVHRVLPLALLDRLVVA